MKSNFVSRSGISSTTSNSRNLNFELTLAYSKLTTLPVMKLSTPTTVKPSFRSRSTRWDPTNPAAPETNALFNYYQPFPMYLKPLFIHAFRSRIFLESITIKFFSLFIINSGLISLNSSHSVKSKIASEFS